MKTYFSKRVVNALRRSICSILCQQRSQQQQQLARFPVSATVQEALRLPDSALVEPQHSEMLAATVQPQAQNGELPTPYDLFFENGIPLPCWREQDQTLYGNWLTSPQYYPVYFSIFRSITGSDRPCRMLEIGVRTGYMGVVFARAACGSSFYLGLDPNKYLQYGLYLASNSLRIMRATYPRFDFALIEGYSWNNEIQRTLTYSAPFDIIHIDGDHTVPGKLVDLELARQLLAPGGIVLIDDYEYHQPVSEAIRRFLALGYFSEFAHISTVRGLAVLR